MRITLSRGTTISCCLSAGLLWGVMIPSVALAQRGGLYVGLAATGERLDVMYAKSVDNTDPDNMSSNQGKVLRSDASAASLAYSVGFLAGYRLALRPTGVYLSFEGDMARYGGVVQGALPGAGSSEGRDQLGESWPEDWSFERDRSYGATVRIGSGIPILGWGSGTSVYALVGLRRFNAEFSSEYTGCLNPEPCTAASELTSGSDNFDESFTGWATGGGLEKRFGNFGIRGELRYTDHGNAGRVIPFNEVAVQVPLSLGAKGVSARADLLWYF